MRIKIDETDLHTLKRELFARVDVETAGLLFAEPQPTDDGVVLRVRVAFALPEDAYLIRRGDRLRIDPVWLNRLIRPARDAGWSVLTVHTHPSATRPWFSPADDDGDARLMPALAVQVPETPHGSLVMIDDGEIAARTFVRGRFAEADVWAVGRMLQRVSASGNAADNEPWFGRQVLALGGPGQARLRSLRVGVVGLGGIGSVVAAQLAHLGVGEIVALDADRVEASNVSRIIGASASDAGVTFKVSVFERYAASLGLPVKVNAIPEHLTDRTVPLLRGCDVVFSCVDRHSPRAILNRLAYDTLLPVVDLGTVFRVDSDGRMQSDAGRVVIIGPGRPCLACWGHIDTEALRTEALTAQARAAQFAAGYIKGADVPQPSVMPFNTMVAGAGVIELLRLVTQFGAADAPIRLAFSFSNGTVRRNNVAADPNCRICGDSLVDESASPLAL